MASSFADRYGPTALVTGAANGIGRGFAEGLATRVPSLLLVDIDAEGLDATARALGQAHDVGIETLVADLGQLSELGRVCETALAREVGLLVNNAGFGFTGSFLGRDLQDHLDVLDVNIRAKLVLSHRLAPAMVDRGRGGIIFTASIASILGAPGVGHYAATKAYIRGLSECLYGELHAKGVDVIALMPGLTRSKGVTAGLSDEEIRALPAMDPGPVAQAALDALGRRPWVIPGFKNRLKGFLMRHAPRGPLLRRMGRSARFS